MNRTKIQFFRFILGAAFLISLSPQSTEAQGKSYYKEGYKPIFNPYPTDVGRGGKGTWKVKYFGPTGIGISLKRPGMTMEINNIEEGSPGDKTGKLRKGQIIESINGQVLKDIDPRILLGNIITEAEATDGVIDLKIKDKGNVRVQIPVMGSYSETWPVNCPKSDKIVRNLADLLGRLDEPSNGAVLFLLSTGEEKDLNIVRRWMQNINEVGGVTWDIGYKGIGVCEYYLRTGDKSVIPAIEKSLNDLKDRMYNGGWSGRGAPASFTYSTGTGQVHASGMYAMNFILMAKLCGVEVDEYLFNESFQQFYRFAGHGNVPYGNGSPEGGFRDNGKHSGLAIAMAVAAQISPEGESSVYANARDTAAMKSFYATNWFHAAHTGGGMGEIWHHGAMALMREKRPVPYRSYMDTRRWVMDSSRRHDGSIAIEGMDDRYNISVTDANGKRDWGTFFALTYTYPRKQLQIWGAPRSPYAKQSPLPPPWGNAADAIFQSPKPIYAGESVQYTWEELMNEQVPTDASLPVLDKLNDPKVSQKELFKYLLHPEYGLRVAAARAVVKHGFSSLTIPLLKSDDPRLREAGLLTITGMFKGRGFPDSELTEEMFDLIGQMVEDPNEAWWVTMYAIEALGRAETKKIAMHSDRLMEFLKHESPWIRRAAVITLSEIATERDHYKEVLPAIIATTAGFTVDEASRESFKVVQDKIKKANPDVKKYATPYLKKAFTSIPQELVEPNTNALMKGGAKTIRTRIGNIVEQVPDGDDFVRRIPKTTLKSYISGRDSDMYVYDGFVANDEVIGTWLWAVYPAPNSPDEIDDKINRWLKPRLGKGPVKIGEKPKSILVIEPNGKISKSRSLSFWSGDMLVSNNNSTAVKMFVKTYSGVDFLIVERGGFNPSADDEGLSEVPTDYHPGYTVYMRQQEE